MCIILKKGHFGLFLIYIYLFHTIFRLHIGKNIFEGRNIMNSRKLLRLSFIFSLIISLSANGIEFMPQKSQPSSLLTAASATTTQEKLVVPGGKSIGVILSTDGVMVVNVAEVENVDGNLISPAKDAEIKAGDLIKAFNGEETSNVSELCTAVNNSNGKPCAISIIRDENALELLISPELEKGTNTFKIGAWVKDAVSGIGTITYYDPTNNTFAALGHGICDPQTNSLVSIDEGSILSSTIVSLQKGEKGAPGELKGVFSEDQKILGTITQNNMCGIFGKSKSELSFNNPAIPIAKKEMVHKGKAHILTNIEGNIIEQFDVEITRVMPQKNPSSKSLVLKITDDRLIEKTGGIIQGMSGSPIIQNGKLVGAVTHVFVNDPTRGYGIFIENMLAEAEKVK